MQEGFETDVLSGRMLFRSGLSCKALHAGKWSLFPMRGNGLPSLARGDACGRSQRASKAWPASEARAGGCDCKGRVANQRYLTSARRKEKIEKSKFL